MFKGLRTVVYHVADLERAKTWYTALLGISPYFDEPFYVGYNVGGYELGLHPVDEPMVAGTSVVTYWGVDDIEAAYARLIEQGAVAQTPVMDVGDGIKVADVIRSLRQFRRDHRQPALQAGVGAAGAGFPRELSGWGDGPGQVEAETHAANHPTCDTGARVLRRRRRAGGVKLGSFNGRGGAMSTLVGPGPNGSERLYIAYTYISSLDLVAFEPDTGKYQVWRSPEGGAWAMEAGPDGRIYLGTYFQGHILRLDPAKGQLDDLGQAIPGETYVWQLSLGPDGKLYGCTYPGAKLLQVDPQTGAMTDLGKMDPVQNYNRFVCAAPDGWVYCAIGSEKANLVAYNPKTRELRSLIPEADRKPGFGQVVRGADGNAYGTCLGKTYRLRDGGATVIDSLPAVMARTRLKDGRNMEDPGTYPGRELPIFRLAEGPDGKVYGSSVLPEYLLRFDPAEPKPVTMGLIPGAEAYSMLTAHDKLFIASYTGATLQVYDPKQEFKPGQARTNNPSFYGSTAPEQDRPYDIAEGSDGRIYMACVPSYGHFGGALSWYDPKTDTVEHVPTPVKDQALASVCALPNGLLACGTSIEGGPGTKPRATEAVLFLWNIAKREMVSSCVPVPGASILVNLAAGKDGLVYGTAGRTLFAFDPRKRAVVASAQLAQGSVTRSGLLTLKDGRIVALAGSSALFIRYARQGSGRPASSPTPTRPSPSEKPSPATISTPPPTNSWSAAKSRRPKREYSPTVHGHGGPRYR